MEDNKLIAEFMGLSVCTDGISYMTLDFRSLPKYDKSWDSLMPVVDKINETYLSSYDELRFPLLLADIHKYVRNVKINEAYKAIVIFINWYNKQENK